MRQNLAPILWRSNNDRSSLSWQDNCLQLQQPLRLDWPAQMTTKSLRTLLVLLAFIARRHMQAPTLLLLWLHMQWYCSDWALQTVQDTEAIVARFSDLPQLTVLVLVHVEHASPQGYVLAQMGINSKDSTSETRGQGYIEACCWALRGIKGLQYLHIESKNDIAYLYRWDHNCSHNSLFVNKRGLSQISPYHQTPDHVLAGIVNHVIKDNDYEGPIVSPVSLYRHRNE